MLQNKKPLILVAEDDRMYSKVYQNKLTKVGYEVVLAGNGEEAVQQAKIRQPDLILMDLIMPVKDGFTALAELKADSTTKDIKVVIMSNLGQDGDIAKAKGLGALEYFVKANMSIGELMIKIESLVGKGVLDSDPVENV